MFATRTKPNPSFRDDTDSMMMMRGVASPRDRIERLLFAAMLSLSAAGTADLRLCSQMH
jgi:hypothetical protein